MGGKNDSIFVWNEKLLKGQKTAMLLYCLKTGMATDLDLGIAKGPAMTKAYTCVFVPAKSAMKADFVEWLSLGKPLVTGYKEITVEEAKQSEKTQMLDQNREREDHVLGGGDG